ncbi:hypothetical protein FP744_10006145 [Trichoderma asperellum]|nr:putative monocarboxylate transporter [Trichoderma asperelloides]
MGNPTQSIQSHQSDEFNIAENKQIDTWRGWVVVAAAASTVFVYLGIIYSWGLLEASLVDTTGYSLTTLTFVGSLATSFMISVSLFARFCIQRFGYQKTALAGAFLMGLGEFVVSWASDHIIALFLLHGVTFGVGGGLSMFACSTAPLSWFKRHRGLAVGIVFGGGSLGAAVFGVATKYMINNLSTAWAFRILGVLVWAVGIPSSFFIRHSQMPRSKVTGAQWFLFRDRRLVILSIGLALSTFSIFIPPYFIPIFAKAIHGFSDSALVGLAVWNLASTIGRVFGGFAADHLLGPINCLLVSTFLTGISALLIWPFASNLAVLLVFIIINGIGCGSFFSLVPPVLGRIFGVEIIVELLPMVWTTWFFGFFFGTPIASSLYSLSNGNGVAQYRPAAFFAGAMSVLGLTFMLGVRFMVEKRIFVMV